MNTLMFFLPWNIWKIYLDIKIKTIANCYHFKIYETEPDCVVYNAHYTPSVVHTPYYTPLRYSCIHKTPFDTSTIIKHEDFI